MNRLALALLVLFNGSACGGSAQEDSTFVGASTCAECHQAEYQDWLGSHHDLAMQLATDETVLGAFDGSTLTHFGTTSTFTRRDSSFVVRTEGPRGELGEYEIAYTFGAEPLQQYLVSFPGGRFQALDIAWDSRSAERGGQRWFHLYPDENTPPGDAFHWTGRNNNWNYMCAECHSTNLQKNYEAVSETYATTWSEIDVGCEACHGPGSQHVDWARRGGGESDDRQLANLGLAVRLSDSDRAGWTFDDSVSIARRTIERTTDTQVEGCARCHARRGVVSEQYEYGNALLDSHRPALLSDDLYYADGQILDEVYVYGSFLQSKMYRAGVTCSNCHNPHSLRLVSEGNAVCATCHLPDTYDTPEHHFHPVGSAGTACVECHMPTRTYMVVDPRRDHSFRVPRPDLSRTLGTPNACTSCHQDRSLQWAESVLNQWHGSKPVRTRHFGEVLSDARLGVPGSDTALARLTGDSSQAGVVRATAASLLTRVLSAASARALESSLRDPDPLVRFGAATALDRISPSDRIRFAFHLLEDSVRTVRLTAARALAAVPRSELGSTGGEIVDRVIDEYVRSQQLNGEQPESHVNLGTLYAERGEYEAAEESYRKALDVDSMFAAAYVNLSDLYRIQGRDTEGESVLRRALRVAPRDPTVHHALGLLLVRLRRHEEALDALRVAAEGAPANARFSYVYGVALHSMGNGTEAVSTLEAALHSHPYDRELLAALITINRDVQDLDAAVRYARRYVESWPEDPGARQLLNEVVAARGRQR